MGGMSRIAVVLVSLMIVMLPFHTSYVLGSALEVQDASGSDNIFNAATNIGYKRYTDNVSIVLHAEFSEDTLSVNKSNVQVQRGSSGYFSVDSCSGGSSGTCEMTNLIMSTGQTYYSARLIDDAGNTIRMTTFRIVSDTKAPQISSFSVTPDVSTSGDFTLSYDVKDTAFDTTDGVGINTIWITSDGTLDKTISGGNANQKSDSISYSPSGGEGYHDICIKASDVYGQNSSEQCVHREVDSTAPQALNMTIYGDGFAEVSYLSDKSKAGYVIVYFDSPDLDESTIEADLSMFTSETDKISPTSCYDNGIVTQCRWDSLALEINQSLSSPSATFDFQDKAGNSGQSTLTAQSIGYDATGPQFVSLQTAHGQLSDGSWKIYQKNNFTLTLSERDLGGSIPSLDLSEIGAGSSVVADSCEQNGQTYTCSWHKINAPEYSGEKEEVYTIKTNNITDSLGNGAQNSLEINVTVDTLGPEIKDTVVVTHPQSGHEVYANRTVKGDILEITSVIEDPGTQISATANFSNLINSSESHAASCTNTDGNQWNCTWTTDVITTDSIGNVSFSYTVTDDVGNTEDGEGWVYLYGLMNNTEFNHWKHSVTCSPDLIDRQVTEFVNFRSYCSVDLSPEAETGANIDPIDIQIGQCQPTDNTSSDYVSDASFMNHGAGSTNPVIKMELAAKKMDIDWINYSCTVTILSLVDDGQNKYVTEFYESENVSIELGFYNLPLGEYSDEMKEEIKSVRDSSIVGMNWIGKLQEIIDILMQICDIIDLLNKIHKTWTAFQFAISWGETNPYMRGVVETTKQGNEAYDKSKEAWLKTLTKYCDYVTCDRTLWDAADAVSPELANWKKEKTQWIDDKALVISSDGFQTKGSLDSNGDGDADGGLQNYLQDHYALTLDMFPSNPKESLILSIGTLCIPGILDGIQRWRQIQCNYGVCLIDSMRMNMPQTVCMNQKDYLECKYVAGEIFNLIPWVKSIQNLLSGIKNVLSDPLSMVFSVAGYACTPQLHSAEPHAACLWSKIVLETIQIANMIKEYVDQGFGEMFSSESNDRCDEFETKLEEVGLSEDDDD